MKVIFMHGSAAEVNGDVYGHYETDVALTKARLLNGEVVDGSSYNEFFINIHGVKVLEDTEEGLTKLQCSFDDELIRGLGGVFRIKQPEDYDEEIIISFTGALESIASSVYTSMVTRSSIYDKKLAAATSYRDAGYPPVLVSLPYLTKEANLREISEQDLSEMIINKADKLYEFGERLEIERLAIYYNIHKHKTVEAKNEHTRVILTELDEIARSM